MGRYAKVKDGLIESISASGDVILTDEEVNSGVIVVQVNDDAEVGDLASEVEEQPEAPEAPPPAS